MDGTAGGRSRPREKEGGSKSSTSDGCSGAAALDGNGAELRVGRGWERGREGGGGGGGGGWMEEPEGDSWAEEPPRGIGLAKGEIGALATLSKDLR